LSEPNEDGPAGLWRIVREIPRGRAAAYGDVGRALDAPVSGLLVGRWMARCPEGVPWWRVVGKDGSLLLAKRDPQAAKHQADRLLAEGVDLIDGRVDMDRFGYLP
jgi:methylated-DNA-protein-cysteine methyltransferase-like protein